MRITIEKGPTAGPTYRAARVRSLFNCEGAAEGFALSVDLPETWEGIGVIHGPSGSGKTTLGRALVNQIGAAFWAPDWPTELPLIEALGPTVPFDQVTQTLAAVGLGSVPAWLRPYSVLSNGERFRADMARLVLAHPTQPVIVDEFTSVLDRQIAQVGAAAFAKAWRRAVPNGRLILLTPHEDILDWIDPDWTCDTATGAVTVGRGRRRPPIPLEIVETGWANWPIFEPHHYLKLPHMIAARCYVGTVDGAPVAHLGVTTRPGVVEARACRLVVMPEWQGIGVGMAFLNAVCAAWAEGDNPFRRPLRTLFHTSHPGLAAALRRHQTWTQVSAALTGDNKQRAAASLRRTGHGTGYGGHLRAVQGFRYLGAPCESP